MRERTGRRFGLLIGGLLALWALTNDVALWAAAAEEDCRRPAVTTTTVVDGVTPDRSTPPRGRRPA